MVSFNGMCFCKVVREVFTVSVVCFSIVCFNGICLCVVIQGDVFRQCGVLRVQIWCTSAQCVSVCVYAGVCMTEQMCISQWGMLG